MSALDALVALSDPDDNEAAIYVGWRYICGPGELRAELSALRAENNAKIEWLRLAREEIATMRGENERLELERQRAMQREAEAVLGAEIERRQLSRIRAIVGPLVEAMEAISNDPVESLTLHRGCGRELRSCNCVALNAGALLGGHARAARSALAEACGEKS